MKLEQLTKNYVTAANALTKYRKRHGFNPGAKVICRFLNDSVKIGTIAPYGEPWSHVDHLSVPVLFENNQQQPWNMQHLTIVRATINNRQENSFQEPYSIKSHRFFDLDALAKFNLKCLKRYFCKTGQPEKQLK